MIRYALLCEHDHEFEGWFASSSAFDEQREGKEILCPHCGNAKIRKALMAPSLGRGTKKAAAQDVAASPASPQEVMQKVGMAMMALRKHVEENCDYVGDKFAEEARRIHYGETKHRDIYGETSLDEAKELIEEGVEVAPLPVLTSRNTN